jgi:hypothetical protein
MISKEAREEQGLVSIIVVTLVVIILALMTTGFAKVMDRELRQSLDRELAVQANYAAESGMNDARNYIANTPDPDTSGDCLQTTSLSATQTPYFTGNGSVSSGAGDLVQYTCVNIDTKPKELVYDIPAGTSRVLKVVPVSGNLSNLFFSWNNKAADASTNATTLPSLGTYPTESYMSALANLQATGVLRATIYPVPASGITGDADLESLAKTYFMYPSAGGGIGQASFNNNGLSVPGNCNQANFTTSPLPFKDSKHFCNSKITNMSPPAPPPPAAPNPTSVTVSMRLEGHPGFASVRYRVVATQPGLPDLVLGDQTVDPSSFPSTGSASCGIAGNGAQRFSNLNPNYPIPAAYNNPTIRVDYVSTDDWDPVVGDNNVIVNNIHIIYSNGANNAISPTFSNAWPGSTSLPLGMCGTGSSYWQDSSPPGAPAPAASGYAFYYVKLTALYRDLTVSVQGTDGTNTSLKFKKAQAVVDVTAKGNDVLKRLQAHIALDPNYDYPENALQSMDSLCKRLRVPLGTGGPADYQPATIDDVFGGVNNSDGACKPT